MFGPDEDEKTGPLIQSNERFENRWLVVVSVALTTLVIVLGFAGMS